MCSVLGQYGQTNMTQVNYLHKVAQYQSVTGSRYHQTHVPYILIPLRTRAIRACSSRFWEDSAVIFAVDKQITAHVYIVLNNAN